MWPADAQHRGGGRQVAFGFCHSRFNEVFSRASSPTFCSIVMLVEDGGEIDLSDFVHPCVEPEIAFLLNKPLEGLVSPAQAMLAVEAIAPALEIIDSRYENFKFNLPDVVADNTSAEALTSGLHVRLEAQNMGSVSFSVK